MQPTRRRLLALTSALSAVAAPLSVAWPQAPGWPSKPIRIIAPERSRQRHRHSRALAGRPAGAGARPADRRREPRRRRRQPGHGRRRPQRTGRLHAPDHPHRHDGDQSAHLRQSGLRSPDRPGADHAAGRWAANAGRAQERAGEFGERAGEPSPRPGRANSLSTRRASARPGIWPRACCCISPTSAQRTCPTRAADRQPSIWRPDM